VKGTDFADYTTRVLLFPASFPESGLGEAQYVDLALEFCTRVLGLQDGVKKFDGPPSQIDKHVLGDIYAMEVL